MACVAECRVDAVLKRETNDGEVLVDDDRGLYPMTDGIGILEDESIHIQDGSEELPQNSGG